MGYPSVGMNFCTLWLFDIIYFFVIQRDASGYNWWQRWDYFSTRIFKIHTSSGWISQHKKLVLRCFMSKWWKKEDSCRNRLRNYSAQTQDKTFSRNMSSIGISTIHLNNVYGGFKNIVLLYAYSIL